MDAEHDSGRLLIKITSGEPGAEAGLGALSRMMEAGLSDAADRIGALGGKLRIEHTPGNAVTIRAEIPCES